MKTSVLLLFVLLFTISLQQCGPVKRDAEEASEIKDAMKSREIKKVLPSDIIEKAREKGKIVTDNAQKTLLSTLMKKIENQGTVDAISFCHLSAMPLIDSLSEAQQAVIRRVSNKWRNPKDAPTEDEKPILEAYQYAIEQGQKPKEEVFMEETSDQVIYTRPIMIGAPLCLQCHGQKEKDLTPEVMAKLDELYPEDHATGYELGQFRGLWKVTFDKKDLVLEL